MIIAIVGTVVMATGTTALIFAFRAFGEQKKGSMRHIVLLAVAIAFILGACGALLVWSLLN